MIRFLGAVDLGPQAVCQGGKIVQVNNMAGINILDFYNPRPLSRFWPQPEDKYFPVIRSLF